MFCCFDRSVVRLIDWLIWDNELLLFLKFAAKWESFELFLLRINNCSTFLVLFVQTFVELLYTGESAKFDDPEASRDVFQLIFLLASKYHVAELRILAALKLTQEVNAENFVQLLILAQEQANFSPQNTLKTEKKTKIQPTFAYFPLQFYLSTVYIWRIHFIGLKNPKLETKSAEFPQWHKKKFQKKFQKKISKIFFFKKMWLKWKKFWIFLRISCLVLKKIRKKLSKVIKKGKWVLMFLHSAGVFSGFVPVEIVDLFASGVRPNSWQSHGELCREASEGHVGDGGVEEDEGGAGENLCQRVGASGAGRLNNDHSDFPWRVLLPLPMFSFGLKFFSQRNLHTVYCFEFCSRQCHRQRARKRFQCFLFGSLNLLYCTEAIS